MMMLCAIVTATFRLVAGHSSLATDGLYATKLTPIYGLLQCADDGLHRWVTVWYNPILHRLRPSRRFKPRPSSSSFI